MSDQPTELVLMRHCETSWNAQKRIQGQTDIPLNEDGKTHACELSFALSKETFHAIYASHLKRARYTAFIIAFHHNLEVITDPDLQEGYYGEVEGMYVPDYYAQYKEALEAYEKLPRKEKLIQTVVPGVESRGAIVARVEPALHRIARNHPGKRVLVVTHGGVLHSLLMSLSDDFSNPLHLKNGAQVHLTSNARTLTFSKILEPLHTQ